MPPAHSGARSAAQPLRRRAVSPQPHPMSAAADAKRGASRQTPSRLPRDLHPEVRDIGAGDRSGRLNLLSTTPCGEEPATARRRWTRPTPAGPSSPRRSAPRQPPSATIRANSCTQSSTRPPCTREAGGDSSTCTAAPILRTPSTAHTPRTTSPGLGAGSRHTRPDSAGSRRVGTNSRSRTASGS